MLKQRQHSQANPPCVSNISQEVRMLPYTLDPKGLTVSTNSNDELVVPDIHDRSLGDLRRLDLDLIALGVLLGRWQDGLAGKVICLILFHADDLAREVYVVRPPLVKLDIAQSADRLEGRPELERADGC